MARERGIFFFFLFPFSFLFLPRDRWKWRRVTVDDEWKIEIKAGSLNYTAQRSSCCNKMARRVIDVQRIERNVSPRVVSSPRLQSNWTGFHRRIFPYYNKAFEANFEPNFRFSQSPITKDIGIGMFRRKHRTVKVSILVVSSRLVEFPHMRVWITAILFFKDVRKWLRPTLLLRRGGARGFRELLNCR